MENSEFKLILEDISEKLTVLIEAQNLLIRKLDHHIEEDRVWFKEIKRDLRSVEKNSYEGKESSELPVSKKKKRAS